MSLDKTSLEATVTTQLAAVTNATPLEDLYSLLTALKTSTDNIEIYVENNAALPDLLTSGIPDGQIVYVKSINLHVVSWRQKWMSLDGRVYRDDSNVNTVWGWGWNSNGMLGDNTTVSKSSPVSVVGGFTDWCQVGANAIGYHRAGLRTNGTLWTWGSNSNGQLGDGTNVSKSSPVSVVGGFTDWCQVSAGGTHSAAVRSNGTIWTWGRNNRGQLGDNSIVDKSSPTTISGGFTDWCSVIVGGCHSIAIRTNGTIWSWGANQFGQLGDGTIVSKSSPVSVVGGFTDWCQVSASEFHSLAIRTNGTLWTWGGAGNGELGDNTTANKSSPVSVIGGFTDWCQVSAGGSHSMAIRTNGTVWAWGYGGCGRLGDNASVNKSSPVSVVGGFTDWCQVSAGGTHSAAVRSNGTLWSWGRNLYGGLGDNSVVNRSSPVSVVGGFTSWCQVSGGRFITLAISSC